MEKKKSKSFFKKIFRQFDLFGTFITFTIKGENDYKSFLGGITTFSLILIMGVYVCYMSYRFLARKEFDFIFSNKIIDDPFLNLTDINFNMAFGVQYANNHTVVDPSIYDNFNFSLYMSINNYKYKDVRELYITYHQCTNDDYYDLNSINKDSERQKMNLTKMQQIFVLHELFKMKCPIKPENDDLLPESEKFINNFFLQGTYVDLKFRYLNIDVKIKDSVRKNNEEYKKFKKVLEENPLEVILLYIDTGINYEEKINTLPNYVGFMIKEIDINFTKTTDIFVSNIEFYNDLNIFFSHGTLTKDVMFDYMIDSFKYIDRESDTENNLPLVTLKVKASPKIIQLNRVYQKFPSFIADLTGILEEILVLSTIIVNYFEKKIMDKKLINRVLTYKQGIFFQTDDFIKEKPILNIKLNEDKESYYTSYSVNKSKISKNENKYINKLKNNNVEIYAPNIYKDESNDNNKEIIPYEYKIKRFHNQQKFNNENNLDLISSDRELNKKLQKTETFKKIEKEKESNYLKNKLNNKTIKEEKPNDKKKQRNSKIKNLINHNDFKKITIWTLIFSKICLCSKKKKIKSRIITKLEFKVHHYLDVYNYIEKIQEIDLIKYCIFDEKQMKAFKNIFNPILNENYKPKNNEIINCDIKKWELNDLFKNPEKLEKYLKKNGINI